MKIAERWAMPAVMIGVAGHASSEFVAKLSGVAGPEASVWRYLLGGFGLVLWALAARETRDLIAPLRAEGARIVWLAFYGVTGAYLFFHWALDFATVIQVATLTTTIPIFVGLANWALNGVRPSTVKIVTGVMATIGVALLLTDGALDTLAGDGRSLWGVLLSIACAALVSLYAVQVRPVVERHGSLRVIALTMMLGGIGLWLVVGLAWGDWVNPLAIASLPPVAMWSLLALALWNTTITQLLWIGGLAAARDITRASYLFFLKPVIAAGLAIVFLGDWPSIYQVLAIAVVTGSVAVEIFWTRLRPARRAS